MKRSLSEIVGSDVDDDDDDTVAFVEIVRPDAKQEAVEETEPMVERTSTGSTDLIDSLGISDRVVRSLVKRSAVTDRQVKDAHVENNSNR